MYTVVQNNHKKIKACSEQHNEKVSVNFNMYYYYINVFVQFLKSFDVLRC